MYTIDFETERIDGAMPPKPVGVAIKKDDAEPRYYAWNHPADNNVSKEWIKAFLTKIFKEETILMHNASFDLAVAKYHLDIDYPAKIEDTLLLLFLRDPHADTLSLKPSAEAILNIPPAERDEVHEWIMQNVAGATKRSAGAHISKAPVHLVAPYACMDVQMTYELFKVLHADFKGEAYNRELKLVPILIANTLAGVRLDVKRLQDDFCKYSAVRARVDCLICAQLGRTFSVDSPAELADAIDKSGIKTQWVYTKTGKKSTSKDNLFKAIQDPRLLAYLNYRSTLSTYLETFYWSWLQKHRGGRIHFSWNQVRNSEDHEIRGTRTGRLSSNPSMLNVPTSPPEFKYGLPPLPKMRSYLQAEHVDYWLKRDFSSQEIRVLAHYENNKLMQAFQDNPYLDLHQEMSDSISEALGKPVSRRDAKTVLFSILYGAGLAKLAEQLSCSYEEAKEVKSLYLTQLPGVKQIQRDISNTWASGGQLITFGGRGYWKEASKEIVDKVSGLKRWADFGYKGLNYLIQGSSADITKQAIINYDSIKKDGTFLLSVHDEINISGPLSEMRILDEAMLDSTLDVKLVSDGSFGVNYGELTKIIGET
jgi:DNA polymerase-1